MSRQVTPATGGKERVAKKIMNTGETSPKLKASRRERRGEAEPFTCVLTCNSVILAEDEQTQRKRFNTH